MIDFIAMCVRARIKRKVVRVVTKDGSRKLPNPPTKEMIDSGKLPKLMSSVPERHGMFIEENVASKKGPTGGRYVDDECPIGVFLGKS